ncbi:hypothetical protein, partial [Klebsiella pneumoniae]|uniref:hypothetical protein n=1 Tax=Klebsiella pneumoniae TaxID=573 RepID=UPI0025A1DBA5
GPKSFTLYFSIIPFFLTKNNSILQVIHTVLAVSDDPEAFSAFTSLSVRLRHSPERSSPSWSDPSDTRFNRFTSSPAASHRRRT